MGRHLPLLHRGRLALAMVVPALLAACAEGGALGGGEGPYVEEISKHRLVIGEELLFYGHDFLAEPEGTTQLVFRGTYRPDIGDPHPVELTVTPAFIGTEGEGEDARQVLRWSRVGPFGNPFNADRRPGVFEGTVTVRTVAADQLVTEGTEAKKVRLEVLPSLIIEELQPIEAECSAPALRGLAGIPYRIGVRAVGMRPVRFEYAISHINGRDGVTTYVHEYGNGNPVTEDAVGDDEPVVFNPIPPDLQYYVTVIRVVARDAKGRTIETALPFTVHRPIEVSYDGSYERAEIYPPVAVSGCIPGSTRTVVSYSERHTETRQQTVSVTISSTFMEELGQQQSRNWEEGITAGETVSHTLGGAEWEGETATESYNVDYERSEANRVGLSSSNGEKWLWEVNESEAYGEYMERMAEFFGEGSLLTTVGVKGEGSIPGFASVTGSVETTAGVTAGGRTRGTQGGTQGRSVRRGWSAGGTHDETRSFGSTTTETQAQSIGGAYALGRSRERTFQNTEARSQSRVWTLGGAATVEEAVSTGITEAEEQTWVSSTSITVGQEIQGIIPRNKVGIFYRQTTRWVKRAEVRAYDLCGLATHLGELQFNHWTWAPELAIADSCDTAAPPSEMPPAQCFISPCGE